MHEQTLRDLESRGNTEQGSEDASVRGVAAMALDRETLGVIEQHICGGAANLQDVYPLSPLQEGILFHHILNRAADTYVLSLLFELESREHIRVLSDAIQKVVDRHDVLRTAVFWEKLPRPVQVVHRRATLPIEQFSLSEGGDVDSRAQVFQRMRPGCDSIDLRKAPLVRLYVTEERQSSKCYAVLKVHHIACDHQSLRLLLAEVMTCVQGSEGELPAPVPFRHHVAQTLARIDTSQVETFFRAKLGDVDESTALFGLADVRGADSQIKEARAALDSAFADRLRDVAKRYGVTSARLFHAACGLVVACISGRDDVVFGTVLLAARQRSERGQCMLGLSVNTLPLRLRLAGVSTAGLLEQTHRELTELLQYEAAPLTIAQQCSAVTGATPLFTTLLNYRHTHADHDVAADGARGVRLLGRGEAWTNYPLTLTVDDLGSGFILMAKADERIGAERMIGYLRCALQSMLEALEQAPGTPAITLNVIPEAERVQVIRSFNATHTDRAHEMLIHQLFEEQVERTPQVAAVMYDEQSMTYAELNSRANQLARHLRTNGVGPDRLVALCVDRGPEMLVGLFGILKAGGAYVPLDPTNPPDRIAHVLTDAKPVALLTQEKFRKALPTTATTIIALDTAWAELANCPAHNLDAREIQQCPSHLAYVIYTSGSTGSPKGVMIEHRNIVNYAVHAARQFDVTGGDGSIVCSSISFDLMLTGLYPTLLAGKTVRMCREQQGMPMLEEELLRADNLAPVKLTPSHLKLLEPALRAKKLAGRIRVLVLGGEALHAEVLTHWRKYSPGTRIFNHYGPTETTVGCIVLEVGDQTSGAIPIGRPVSNTQIYILNRHEQPVPVGVTGEIHVAGACVGRGYINRPDLTVQRFVRDPFNSGPDARMYRTGDLGRWRADGTIEYLGRADDQVKIRGYRIEPAEVQAQLLQHPQVADAVVVTREECPGEKRLVAYVVARERRAMDVQQIRAHMKDRLPDYMVPVAFVVLDRIPLTPNGKVDRRALPPPERDASGSASYEVPHGEIEEVLAGIWQELLRVERVGRRDNFFELGGHSLLIMQMMERLNQAALSTDVRCIFENPILADLAEVLTRETVAQVEVPPSLIPAACEKITPQMLPLVDLNEQEIERIAQSVPGGAKNIQDIYPLAPLQEGILFHYLLNEAGGDVYVIPTLLKISSRQRLEQFIAALESAIGRHDVLRTAVLWERLSRPVQVVYRRATLPVVELELDPDRDALEQVKAWMEPQRQRLDLRQAPMMRLQIAADRCGGWYAMLQVHHIVEDATSLDVVVAEITARLEGREPATIDFVPYRSHVARALEYAKTHDAEAFFRSKLSDIDEPTAPFGLLDVHGDGTRIEQACRFLEPQLAERVRRHAGSLGVSAATVFHAAASVLIAHTSGRDDVVFGTVLLGRLRAEVGARHTLGMFINTLPLRLQLSGVSTRELVETTQRSLQELLNHEQAALSTAQRSSGLEPSTPLFNTLFNYRHSARVVDAEWIKAEGIELLARHGFTNYPITLSVDDLGVGFRLTAQTDRRIDAHRMAQYLQNAVQAIVEALEQAPQTPALELSILPAAESRQVIEAFNATGVNYPREKLIHELFEEQVARTPDRIAVTHEGRSLTYGELDRKANRLARCLRAHGVGPDQLAGICVKRSPEMAIGLLAILKAGGAYMPLDPDYPIERLQYMLESAAPRIVLTQEEVRAALPLNRAEVIDLASELQQSSQHSDQRLGRYEVGLRATNLVYVIYTSGSTGRPKGTGMPHQSMVNLIEWHRRHLDAAGRRVLQFAALSFDVAFQEIFSTLCTGGTLVLLDEWIRRDPRALIDLLNAELVERLFVPPLMLQSLAECFRATGRRPRHLHDVITAGEQLRISPEIVGLFKHLDGCRLHNHYGPTETHVVTSLTLQGSAADWPALPTIGEPIANTQIYVLDKRRRPVPLGVAGEVYIAGANVARGYYGAPQLTADRFVTDRFSADPQARMYKTGDLGRWRPDGSLEYLGRNDDQVKIRGYRIELGEIEACLAGHAHVKEAAVVARHDVHGEKRLVAYVTARAEHALDAQQLRAHLQSMLPEHMIPTAFVVLDRLPLTPSGKLDRRALPAPQMDSSANREYEPPRGEVEQVVAQAWSDMLRVEQIGRGDDFFQLGGHSVLAMRVAMRIQSALSVDVPIRLLFEYPSLKDLSAQLEERLRMQLLRSSASDAADTQELLELVASMPETHVQQLIGELAGGRS